MTTTYAALLREVVERLSADRVAWLDHERRRGGDFDHLTVRIKECQYVTKEILTALDKAKAPGAEEVARAIYNSDSEALGLSFDAWNDAMQVDVEEAERRALAAMAALGVEAGEES